jgi:hypothetical protein
MIVKRWTESVRKKRLRRDVDRAVAGRTTPVIIFQMGKVASSTIEATLQPLERLTVLRTHGLTRWKDVSTPPAARRDLESWLILHKLIGANVRCKVVTVVREPIARNLSAYFQNLDPLLGMRGAHAQLPMSKLIEGFFARYNHQKPLTWFDVEFLPTLGIDVFQHPFDHERGFQRIQTEQFDVLILRADLPDAAKAQQLAELVGVRELAVVQKNVGEAKSYAAVYQQFLREIRLPESYVKEMLEHKFTRHFFTEAEIDKFRERWSRENVPA